LNFKVMDDYMFICEGLCIQNFLILFNILAVRRKFFMCKITEGNKLLVHVNKVKALANELVFLEVPCHDFAQELDDEYLNIALQNDAYKQFGDGIRDGMFDARGGEKFPRQKRNDGVASWQSGRTPLREGLRLCFHSGKPICIARFCYKIKNKEKENAKNTKKRMNLHLQHNMEHIQ
jgi:hypothetical protein